MRSHEFHCAKKIRDEVTLNRDDVMKGPETEVTLNRNDVMKGPRTKGLATEMM